MPGLVLRVLLLAVVTAAVGLSIYGLQYEARAARTTTALLDLLDGVCMQLSGLEWQAVARRQVTPTLRKDIDGLFREHAQMLKHLERRSAEVPALTALIGDERRYAAAIRREIAVIEAGQWPQAMQLDATTVDPLYERIDAQATAIVTAQTQRMRAAERRAAWGSVAVLVTGVLFIIVLLRRNVGAWRRQHEAKVSLGAAQSNARQLSRLLESARDVLLVINPQGNIRFASGAAGRVAGMDAGALVGRPVAEFCHPDDAPRAREWLAETMLEPGSVHEGRLRILSPQHGCRQFEVILTNLLDDPLVEGLLVNASDITRRLLTEEKLHDMAYRDPLTGLANRGFLTDQLTQRANDAVEVGRFALLFMDLDNFKHVNDSLGHQAGDELMVAVGRRLADVVRGRDVLARWGGDEFVLLLENVEGESEAFEVAERLLTRMAQPFRLSGHDVIVGLSIGISLSSVGGGSTAPELLRQADHALYEVKLHRKGGYRLFVPGSRAPGMPRLLLEADLYRAVDEGELEVHYQPIIWLLDGSLADAEALVRWRHPVRGMMAPDDFIPLAEEGALIEHVGRAVWRMVLRDIAEWRAAGVLPPAFRMHVNASPRELRAPGFPAMLAGLMAEFAVPPEMLRLEITERMLADGGSEQRWAAALEAQGLQLCLDDFGTGYSSLASLQLYPLSGLKVDRGFVARLDIDASAPTVLAAMASLAEAFSLEVVAEGIETAEQRELLMAMGYTLGQGYLFSPALEPIAFRQQFLVEVQLAPLRGIESSSVVQLPSQLARVAH